jgi:tRNA (uracil-5-)-methyltransferase TRM9
MDSYTAAKLIELNQLFYQTFALQFSQSRQRLQPGVKRILESLPPTANFLDLGCGNGELACHLQRRGHQGAYVGLDFSQELLTEARRKVSVEWRAVFLQADLSRPGWAEGLPQAPFDFILAFAVLHHLPGNETRQQVLRTAHSLLTAQGRLIHSEWQFLNSLRLTARIQPWESIGLSPAQVDPGDYLLDWRKGGFGLRYVHFFTPDELAALAASSGFKVLHTFSSDGEANQLSLYQTWELASTKKPRLTILCV